MTKTLETALNIEFQWTLRLKSSLELVFRGRTEGNVLETPWTKNVPNADKVYWNPAFWSVKPDTLDVSTPKNGRGVRLRGHAERFGAFLVQLFGHRKSLQDWNSISCRLYSAESEVDVINFISLWYIAKYKRITAHRLQIGYGNMSANVFAPVCTVTTSVFS